MSKHLKIFREVEFWEVCLEEGAAALFLVTSRYHLLCYQIVDLEDIVYIYRIVKERLLS